MTERNGLLLSCETLFIAVIFFSLSSLCFSFVFFFFFDFPKREVTTLTNAVSGQSQIVPGIWRFLQESGHLEICPGNT